MVNENRTKEKLKRRTWTWCLAIVLIIMYLGSYCIWSRCLPGYKKVFEDHSEYSFTSKHMQLTSDWEESLHAFYFPLVWVDWTFLDHRHKFLYWSPRWDPLRSR